MMIETLTDPVLSCASVQGFPGLMGERGDRGEKGDKVCKPRLKETLLKNLSGKLNVGVFGWGVFRATEGLWEKEG